MTNNDSVVFGGASGGGKSVMNFLMCLPNDMRAVAIEALLQDVEALSSVEQIKDKILILHPEDKTIVSGLALVPECKIVFDDCFNNVDEPLVKGYDWVSVQQNKHRHKRR